MTKQRFKEITGQYRDLRIAVIGDYSLDRYLEIDPSKTETSIETGLSVHNVTRVRAQPGAAGTVLNNLVALGIGEIWPVGFCGDDGEGYELQRVLKDLLGVQLDYFYESQKQRTFTYCKPLVMKSGQPPRELNRLDSKNWHTTPKNLQELLSNAVRSLSSQIDAFVVLDQVDEPETGVVTKTLLQEIDVIAGGNTTIIGDSRRGLKNWPTIDYKTNLEEFEKLTYTECGVEKAASGLAMEKGIRIFVTMAEGGIISSDANGETHHQSSLPTRGKIDIVGAGDAVMANLVAALAASATSNEASQLANAAASAVIHKLGTTGTASVGEIEPLLFI